MLRDTLVDAGMSMYQMREMAPFPIRVQSLSDGRAIAGGSSSGSSQRPARRKLSSEGLSRRASSTCVGEMGRSGFTPSSNERRFLNKPICQVVGVARLSSRSEGKQPWKRFGRFRGCQPVRPWSPSRSRKTLRLDAEPREARNERIVRFPYQQ